MDDIKYTPALIILDIMMPEMSGWELHRRLEEHPALSRTPIVFLTGRTTETAQEMYKRYGIEYITKPFDINNLKDNIERIIELK
jgi:DNA-binding response OmpR family regulator